MAIKRVKRSGKTHAAKGENMPNTDLTAKEVTIISDLLTYEEAACKKARLYSKQLTDPEIADKFTKIADNHEKRFNALLALL